MKKIGSYFKTIQHSRDGKVLVENVFYLSLLNVAVHLFPLLTIPYLARVIGVDGVGRVAFAAAVMVWVQTIADWGFDCTAVRDLSQHRDDRKAVSEIFSNVLWARLLLALLAFVVLIVLIITIPKFRENALILIVSFLLVPGHIFTSGWFFQGMEQMKYSTILGVVSRGVFTIAVFIFVKSESDYWLQPLLSSLGTVVAGCISWYLIIKQFQVKVQKPYLKSVISTIKGSTDVFINTLMPNFYNNFSAILLGFYGGSTANGLYDAGKKIANVFNSFLHTVSKAFFPYLSRKKNKHAVYASINLAMAGICTLFILIFAPQIIRIFYGVEFMDAVIVARITAFALFFVTMDYVYSQNYLIANNYDKIARNITISVSIIGFIIAFPLIKSYGYIGAAITYTISDILIGILPMIMVIKIRRKDEKANHKK